MSYYLDTSALVKLYHWEVGSGVLRTLYEGREALILSDLTRLEMVSATARRFREKRIDETAFHKVLARFSADLESRFHVVRISEAVIDEGAHVLASRGMKFPLRSLDAIQFGTFLTYCNKETAFVGADKRLLELVQATGFSVLDPTET